MNENNLKAFNQKLIKNKVLPLIVSASALVAAFSPMNASADSVIDNTNDINGAPGLTVGSTFGSGGNTSIRAISINQSVGKSTYIDKKGYKFYIDSSVEPLLANPTVEDIEQAIEYVVYKIRFGSSQLELENDAVNNFYRDSPLSKVELKIPTSSPHLTFTDTDQIVNSTGEKIFKVDLDIGAYCKEHKFYIGIKKDQFYGDEPSLVLETGYDPNSDKFLASNVNEGIGAQALVTVLDNPLHDSEADITGLIPTALGWAMSEATKDFKDFEIYDFQVTPYANFTFKINVATDQGEAETHIRYLSYGSIQDLNNSTNVEVELTDRISRTITVDGVTMEIGVNNLYHIIEVGGGLVAQGDTTFIRLEKFSE